MVAAADGVRQRRNMLDDFVALRHRVFDHRRAGQITDDI
jgi:hypothetical protein